jgi:type IV pilus assembly protein PilC
MASEITVKDIALFTRQLVTMLKADVSLVQSLEIAADAAEMEAMKDLTLEVRDDVAAGKPLAAALSKHPDQFDGLFCKLVDAGAQAEAMELMLDRIALYKEKTAALLTRIQTCLNYSLGVLLVLFCILLIMTTPGFAFAVMVVVALLIFGYRAMYWRSEKLRELQHQLVSKVPGLSDILRAASIARYARTLATTFSAGVPLLDALEAVAGAAGNTTYYNAVIQIRQDVSEGVQLNHAMKQTEVFPNLIIRMVTVGEQSGTLDVMLDRAATYYEERVENAIDTLVNLMQPILICILGVVIGIHVVTS